MDEKTAWRIFCSTGKITDYMNYSQIHHSLENGVTPIQPHIKDLPDADKDRRNSNSGADYR